MGYRQRLRRDLDRWIEAGLVDTGHREAILASARGGPTCPALQSDGRVMLHASEHSVMP